MKTRESLCLLLPPVILLAACAGVVRERGSVPPPTPAESPGPPMPDAPPEGMEIRVLDAGSAGAVVFHHSKHLVLEGVDCEKCHGKPDAGGNYRPCVPCHVSRGQEMTLERTYHGFCKECHEKPEWAAAGAPVECEGCHDQPSRRSAR